MKEDSILDYKRLEIKRLEQADDEIVSLLESTVLGSEGGMRYSMQNIGDKIKSYGAGISFMALYKRSNLAGVIGLCHRKTRNCGVEYDTTHLRYLSMRSAFQTPAAASHHREEHLSHVEESFKHKLLSMFSNPYKEEPENEQSAKPHVMYAFVESRNERSKNLINKAGYEYIRSFLTIAFSRFYPKPSDNVAKLSNEEEPAMARLLAEQYRNYCFYTDEFTFFNHNYYVLKKEGEILAGVSVIPTKFKVVNMPGVWGWIMMKIMPRMPYFRRIFKPGEFRYLVLNSIYCREGSENLLPELFESACATEGYNTALTWLDDHSALFQSLITNRRMGALNRILNAKPGLVYASFSNIDPAEHEKFYEFPAFISGFDFS
jgi:hypothetical protein